MIYSIHILRHLRLTIGRNIHSLRLKHKLTLRKLSRLNGIPECLLDQYELGKNEIRLEEVLKISCVLEVRLSKLLAVN